MNCSSIFQSLQLNNEACGKLYSEFKSRFGEGGNPSNCSHLKGSIIILHAWSLFDDLINRVWFKTTFLLKMWIFLRPYMGEWIREQCQSMKCEKIFETCVHKLSFEGVPINLLGHIGDRFPSTFGSRNHFILQPRNQTQPRTASIKKGIYHFNTGPRKFHRLWVTINTYLYLFPIIYVYISQLF